MPQQPPILWLDSDAMPQPFRDLDRSAVRLNRTYLRAASAQLLLFLLASVLSSMTYRRGSIDVALLGASLCFACAMVIQIAMTVFRWEEIWKSLRHAAEVVKSLAIAYAVGGEPFPLGTADRAATDQALIERVVTVLTDVRSIRHDPVRPGDAAAVISPVMRQVRSSPLHVRVTVYAHSRIEDLSDWYRRRAIQYRRRAVAWSGLTLSIQVLALSALVAQGLGLLHASVFGIASAIGGTGAAYAQNRQYNTLTREYASSARRLAVARAQLAYTQADGHFSDANWPQIVGETETQIQSAL